MYMRMRVVRKIANMTRNIILEKWIISIVDIFLVLTSTELCQWFVLYYLFKTAFTSFTINSTGSKPLIFTGLARFLAKQHGEYEQMRSICCSLIWNDVRIALTHFFVKYVNLLNINEASDHKFSFLTMETVLPEPLVTLQMAQEEQRLKIMPSNGC